VFGAIRVRKSVAAGEGVHHVGLTKDEKLGFVQNSLLNLPGMSDGSITEPGGRVRLRLINVASATQFWVDLR
jgi:hypothetical protein